MKWQRPADRHRSAGIGWRSIRPALVPADKTTGDRQGRDDVDVSDSPRSRDRSPTVIVLFDGYCPFYAPVADYAPAEALLRERFANPDPTLFLALEPASGEGGEFVQLYPSFSSVALPHPRVNPKPTRHLGRQRGHRPARFVR
jgi:hypothetical protein